MRSCCDAPRARKEEKEKEKEKKMSNARSLWEHAAFTRRPRKNRAAAKRKTARIVGDRLPRELEVLMGRANRDYVRGDYASAVTSLREALELNPSLVEAWVTIGRIHGESGRQHDALAALNYAAEKVRSSRHPATLPSLPACCPPHTALPPLAEKNRRQAVAPRRAPFVEPEPPPTCRRGVAQGADGCNQLGGARRRPHQQGADRC